MNTFQKQLPIIRLFGVDCEYSERAGCYGFWHGQMKEFPKLDVGIWCEEPKRGETTGWRIRVEWWSRVFTNRIWLYTNGAHSTLDEAIDDIIEQFHSHLEATNSLKDRIIKYEK